MRSSITTTAKNHPHRITYGFKWKYAPYRECSGEKWKIIEQHPDYKISTYGRVMQPNGRISDFIHEKRTTVYAQMQIRDKSYHRHILVAQAFIPNPEGKPVVNHKDGNKLNIHVSNLESATHAENTQHAYDSGLNSAATPVILICKKTQKRKKVCSMAEAAKIMRIPSTKLMKKLQKTQSYETSDFCVNTKLE